MSFGFGFREVMKVTIIRIITEEGSRGVDTPHEMKS